MTEQEFRDIIMQKKFLKTSNELYDYYTILDFECWDNKTLNDKYFYSHKILTTTYTWNKFYDRLLINNININQIKIASSPLYKAIYD